MISNREISYKELVEHHLQIQDRYNALCEVYRDDALQQAIDLDRKISRGYIPKMLDGIPIGIKDLFCQKGKVTSAASNILKDFVPDYDATVVAKLKHSGAIPICRTNMDEFAMGSANLFSRHGPAMSPWVRANDNAHVVPGGSSGGSSSAVASGLCVSALGSDTGGSIRQPAAFTGIVGLKPTYGRCSRFGMISFASSLDQAGVLTRSVDDAAIMLQAISGYDNKDSTSADIEMPNLIQNISGDIRGKIIGIPKEYKCLGISDEIQQSWEESARWLENSGAHVEEITLPHAEYGIYAYYVIAPSEASSNLSRYDGIRYGSRKYGKTVDAIYCNTRSHGIGSEVKKRIILGAYTLSSGHYDKYYSRAQKVRELIRQDFESAFRRVDAILTPTAPIPAFAPADNVSDITMYMNDVLTVGANLAGLPGISVPSHISKTEKLPLGMQIIGKHFDELGILNIAKVIEKSRNGVFDPYAYTAQ